MSMIHWIFSLISFELVLEERHACDSSEGSDDGGGLAETGCDSVGDKDFTDFNTSRLIRVSKDDDPGPAGEDVAT